MELDRTGTQRQKVLRVAITDPQVAKRLLQENPPKISQYEKSIILGKGVISVADHDEWEWQRGIMKTVVSGENIRQVFFPTAVRMANRLIGQWKEQAVDGVTGRQAPVEIHTPFLIFAFGVIVNALFGRDGSNEELKPLSWAYMICMEREMANADIRTDPEYAEAKRIIDAFIYPAVDQGPPTEPNSKALVSVIMAKDASGCPFMSRDLQRDNISSLLIAGSAFSDNFVCPVSCSFSLPCQIQP